MNCIQLKYHLLPVFLGVISTFATSCSTQKKGFIVTNANDTISGKFKLIVSSQSSANGVHNVFTLFNSRNKKNNIYIDSIDKINIVKRGKIIDSYIISNNDFWRLLDSKDNLSVYARHYTTTTSSSNYGDFTSNGTNTPYIVNTYNNTKYLVIAIFLGRDQKVQIYNDSQIADDTYIGKKVLKFINIRYKINHY